jgi:hypothetical protein
MTEKKYITISFPSVPLFYSTDPALANKNTENAKMLVNLPFEGLEHLLSDKPLFRPGPRPKVETPKSATGTQPEFRFVPDPAPASKPPETTSE